MKEIEVIKIKPEQNLTPPQDNLPIRDVEVIHFSGIDNTLFNSPPPSTETVKKITPIETNDILLYIDMINRDDVDFMTLFKEVVTRFNTDPKVYIKKDYLRLILAIYKVKSVSELELSQAISELTTLISTKVDKETGKFLMEEAERIKLAGIEAGAEVNVQSDWSLQDSSNDAFIKNKPTKLSLFINDVPYLVLADIAGKQDKIEDLDLIREGAAKGLTALLVESDPIFTASPASGITQEDITRWNSSHVQVLTDWELEDSTAVDYIKNKPTLITKLEIIDLFIDVVTYSLRLCFSGSGLPQSEYSVLYDTKELKVTIADPGNKMTLETSSSTFTDGYTYPIRLKTGGKTDSKLKIQIITPEAGTLGIAIRSASASATDRTIALSGAATLEPTIVADSLKVGEQYPIISVPCTEGTSTVTISGAMNIYGVTFTNEDV